MSPYNGEPLPPAEDAFAAAPPAGPRGNAWLGWLVVLLLAGGFVYFQTAAKPSAHGDDPRAAANLVVLEIRMRAIVGGWHALVADKNLPAETRNEARTSLLRQVEEFNRAGIDQRLRALITLGEIDGPARAREELDKLTALIQERGYQPTTEEAARLEVLGRLYDDYAAGRPQAPTVAPDERRELLRHLGWFGELALDPPAVEAADVNPPRGRALAAARRTLQTLTAAGLFVSLALLVGVLALFLLGLRALRGKVDSRLGPPVPHHALYVETFGLWLGLYLILLLAAQAFLHERLGMAGGAAVAMLLSLSALGWPVFRGVPWREVRQDVGLHLGRQPLLEPSYGILTYFMCLPFLAAGMALSIALLGRFLAAPTVPGDPFAPDTSLAHPLVEQFAHGSFRDLLPMFFLACVVAPTLEEIMFRGVLYRHLRDATRWTGRGAAAASVLVSALVVNVLFGVVHPQGMLAVPMLASLAFGFVLSREWRGTILPAIIAHGLNNTLILTALVGLSS